MEYRADDVQGPRRAFRRNARGAAVRARAGAKAVRRGECAVQPVHQGARTSDIVYHQASNWLLGYVSGMNAAMQSSNAAAVINLTNDQVLKSAIDYCTANPDATIAAAAGQWYAQLPKQAEPPPQQAQSQGRQLDQAQSRSPGAQAAARSAIDR